MGNRIGPDSARHLGTQQNQALPATTGQLRPSVWWLQRTLGNQAFGRLLSQDGPAPHAVFGPTRVNAASAAHERKASADVLDAGGGEPVPPTAPEPSAAALTELGPGEPLPDAQRWEREAGTDLTAVRLHRSPLAAGRCRGSRPRGAGVHRG